MTELSNETEILKGWEEAIKIYKPRELTPLEKLQFREAQAQEEYCKKVKFVLGEPI